MTTGNRNVGEWIRSKNHHCGCFTRPEEGPFQYEPGETYFCFKGLHNPWSKNNASRYSMLLNQFSPDPATEIQKLHRVHAEEIARGLIFLPSKLRLQLRIPRSDALQETWDAISEWLNKNMIDEIDHRLWGEFKTQADWDCREKELVAKYAPHDWSVIPGIAPTRWHLIHAYSNTIEMVHRADFLFVGNRPKWEKARRSDAAAKVESMVTEGKQPKPRKDWD